MQIIIVIYCGFSDTNCTETLKGRIKTANDFFICLLQTLTNSDSWQGLTMYTLMFPTNTSGWNPVQNVPTLLTIQQLYSGETGKIYIQIT